MYEQELSCSFFLKTFAEARRIIDDYIYFYNYQRIQTKTKLTPIEFRRQYVA